MTATTATGRDGRFRFPYLRVGSYELVVGKPGFRDATHPLSLTVGAAFELPVSLSVGAVDTNVTVTGETTVLEAARSQIAGTVPQAEVQSVPLNGRNFLELALLVPGVSPTNVGSTQLFPETSAVPGISLSINSQRNLSNNFIVDGLSANDDAAGLSGITYGVDALEQVQVVTSGGQAELGRALGGHINIVTRSGTNTLHGTVYDYLRDDRFNARNPLSGTTLPMDQSQYGGSLGGPVVQGRTFYFANVEQRRLDQTGLTTITPANASHRERPAHRDGLPGSTGHDRGCTRIPWIRPTSSPSWITTCATGTCSASATASTTSTPRTHAAPADSTLRAHRRRSTTWTRPWRSATCSPFRRAPISKPARKLPTAT